VFILDVLHVAGEIIEDFLILPVGIEQEHALVLDAFQDVVASDESLLWQAISLPPSPDTAI